MNPILIQTQHFSFSTFWVLISLAIIICSYVMIKIGSKSGLKIQFLSENAWLLFFWGLVGSRLLAVISNYQLYFSSISPEAFFQLFKIWDNGLNIWGAFLGFLIALYYLCKKNDQDFLKWLDLMIPIFILGIGIGSIGAFFEGINYGHESSLPWAVNFESPAIKYTVPIHPSQIYAFLYATTLAITLFFLRNSKKIQDKDQPGFIAVVGVFSFSILKFLEEFTRGDDSITIFGIRLPQIISLIIAISAGIFFHLRYNKPRKMTKRKISL